MVHELNGPKQPGIQLPVAQSILPDVCIKTKTPFFFKQWGGVRKKENGRMLEKRIWDEMPVAV